MKAQPPEAEGRGDAAEGDEAAGDLDRVVVGHEKAVEAEQLPVNLPARRRLPVGGAGEEERQHRGEGQE